MKRYSNSTHDLNENFIDCTEKIFTNDTMLNARDYTKYNFDCFSGYLDKLNLFLAKLFTSNYKQDDLINSGIGMKLNNKSNNYKVIKEFINRIDYRIKSQLSVNTEEYFEHFKLNTDIIKLNAKNKKIMELE